MAQKSRQNTLKVLQDSSNNKVDVVGEKHQQRRNLHACHLTISRL